MSLELFECLVVKHQQCIMDLMIVFWKEKFLENNIKQIIQNSDGTFSEEKLTYWQLPLVKGVNILTENCNLSNCFYLQVTCLACDNKSNTIEAFWDLSLEFPERYQCNGKDTVSQPCLVTEMLANFTETEVLEGKIYVCDQCNCKQRLYILFAFLRLAKRNTNERKLDEIPQVAVMEINFVHQKKLGQIFLLYNWHL